MYSEFSGSFVFVISSSVFTGTKLLTPDVAKKILTSKIVKKRKSLDDVIQVMKKIQKATGINVQRPHIISNMQHAANTSSSASAMRKLMSPTKTSVGMFSQSQSTTSGHMKSRTLKSPATTVPTSSYKRPLDVALEQNGIDGKIVELNWYIKYV